MTETLSKPKPRTRRSPDGGFAGQGAVRQGGSLPVYICNECGAEVVWAESKRTGRKYLVTVTRGYLDQRFYMGDNLHPRDCGAQAAARQAEWDAHERKQAAGRTFAATYATLQQQRNAGEITHDEFLTAMTAAAEAAEAVA